MSVFLEDSNPSVECPFDPQHRVRETRYKQHLVYCQSENKKNFEQCKYNFSHWVPIGEMDTHLQSHCKEFALTVSAVKNALFATQTSPSTIPPNSELPKPVSPRGFKPLPDCTKLPMPVPKKKPASPQLSTQTKPYRDLLAPIDWAKLQRRETFEPLNKFQIQTLNNGERKRYQTLHMNWRRWKNGIELQKEAKEIWLQVTQQYAAKEKPKALPPPTSHMLAIENVPVVKDWIDSPLGSYNPYALTRLDLPRRLKPQLTNLPETTTRSLMDEPLDDNFLSYSHLEPNTLVPKALTPVPQPLLLMDSTMEQLLFDSQLAIASSSTSSNQCQMNMLIQL